LKHGCHLKTAVWLKECSSKASQSISRVLVAVLHATLEADSPNFTICCRQNETWIQNGIHAKTMHDHSLPSHLLSLDSYKNNSLGTFWYNSYILHITNYQATCYSVIVEPDINVGIFINSALFNIWHNTELKFSYST
jgi:hypothetical protein